MRIKSIEILGFKSFYEKTIVQCHNRINAIVGPNGCGKSNILDAILWILGEQNPRRLRAEAMDDVISNGGEALKPLGLAEVSLVINDLPNDGFGEIVIRRRLFRSGESEYYINGTPCRLKDITEMFLDTGAGARAFSIIGQGKIEQMISAKPEEKRLLIEEVAGILKYKVRRRETESRIKSTIENLARVKDLIKEVGRQMQILSRQAKDAEEFKRLSEEARSTELRINLSKIRLLGIKKESLQADKLEIDNGISSLNGQIKDRDNEVKEIEGSVKRLEENLVIFEKETYGLRSDLQTKQSFQERVKSEICSIDEYVSKLEREIDLLKEQEVKLEGQTENKKDNLERFKRDISHTKNEIIDKEELLSNLKDKITKEKIELDNTKAVLFEIIDKHSSLKAVAVGYEKELNELRSRRDRIKRELSEVEGERETTFKYISDLEHAMHDLDERRSQIKQSNEGIENALFALTTDQEMKKKDILQLGERLNEVNSRLGVLKQIQSNYEWLPEGIGRFLVERKGNGILGLTADFISVEKGYERAIEAALGERLKWVFVKEREAAISAVESLRELSVGRGTFVPITSNFNNGGFNNNGGSVLPLLDKVIVEGLDREIFENMLKGVFIVKSLKEGLELRDEMGEGTSFVTLEGDFLDTTGAISGGFAPEGVFERKREIEELSAEALILERDISRISVEIDASQTEIEEIKGALQKSQKELVEVEIKEAEINKDLSNIRDNLVKIGKKHDVIGNELNFIYSEIEELEMKIDRVKQGITQLEKEKTRQETRYSEIEIELKDYEVQEEGFEGDVANLRVEVATLLEKEKGILEDLDDLTNRIGEIKNRLAIESKEVERKRVEKINLIKSGDEARDYAENLLGIIKIKEEELYIRKNDKEELLNKLRGKGGEIERLRNDLASLQERSHSLQLQINGLGIEIEHTEVEIKKRGVDVDIECEESFEDYDRVTEEDRLLKLKEKIDRFGPVNLLAPEEFTNLAERHKFLNDQVEDLTLAISSLRKAMNRIDRESSKRFTETFEIVNTKFQEIFRRLFRGGEAKLVLTEPEDILNTGVEVMVRPTGKRFQSINLLSGGEKALSAIALVVSACFVKPSPFLLFDEIDAPLDDVNTSQFIALVKEIANKSQVIIITHNKRTMQAVDSLIGVTTDQPGTSKVVSVELQ
ncbi:MAG TPA: chromosome segregation protein SMC [Thermodesulfobacteriota bacterium]